MKFELDTTNIQCPYCWESFEIFLDYSPLQSIGESQQYTEDCYICCRPIVIDVVLDELSQPIITTEAELS